MLIDFVISDDELELLAAQDMAAAITNPYIKIAVVTTDPGVKDFLSKFNNMFGGHPWRTRAFTNLEEAREWCLLFRRYRTQRKNEIIKSLSKKW